MTYEVYADVMLLWNCCINYAAYSLTAVLVHKNLKRSRILIFSIINGLISTTIEIIRISKNIFIQNIIYVVIYFVMTWIFFESTGIIENIKCIFSIIISMFLIKGIFTAFTTGNELSLYVLLSLPLIPITVKILSLRKGGAFSHIHNITMSVNNHSVTTKGFYDTGNTLKGISDKRPVIVISCEMLKCFFPELTPKYMDDYVRTGYFDYLNICADTNYIFYPLPYRTISSQFATIPVFKVDSISYDGTNVIYKNILAGVDRCSLINNKKYKVLLNDSLKPLREENSND